MGTKKDSTSPPLVRRKYDADFKQSAIQLLLNGQSVPQVSHSLGIGESLLYKWRSEHLGGSSKTPHSGKNQPHEGMVFSENEALRKQVKQLEMERDILKKALGIFSRVT